MKVGSRSEVGATLLKTSISKAGDSTPRPDTQTQTQTQTETHTQTQTRVEADAGEAERLSVEQPSTKDLLFDRLLNEADVSMDKLRSAAWTRVPDNYRAPVWQLLIGYLPLKRNRREETLQRKRKEYFDCLPRYYASADAERSEEDQKMLRQIMLDIPRTNPGMPLFHNTEVRTSLERMLYIWAVKHPASGYVQGMNELVTPFYVTFLAHHISCGKIEQACSFDVSGLPADLLDAVEADTYWCMTKLLDGIQDHYTFSQPGLQRMVFRLQGIVQRIDSDLYNHLEAQQVSFIQFAFRWMNCLLVREMKLRSIIRLWDTYLAEEANGFDSFHVYVCSALLVTWSEELQRMPFQDLMVFLQDIPTQDWGVEEIEELLGQAFILKSLFNESPSHLGFLFTLYASTQLAGFGTGTELPVRSNWQHMDTANMRTLVKLYAQPKPYTFRLLHPNSIHLDTEDITKLGIAGGSGFSKLNEEVAAMAKESAGKKVKTVYMIRHGEGNHNTAEKKFGKEHWEKVEALKDKYLDASLNEVGIEQCRRVQAAITAGLDGGMLVDGIIVSPLSRALETAAIVMEKVWTNTKVPKVAVEMTRERLGKNQCDKRRSNKELKEKWPMVDFDHFMNAEEDIWWTPVRETNEQVKERSQHFFQWLMDTEWESIVLVGHSSFMSNTYELLSGGDTHWPSNGEVVPIVIEATPQ